MRRQTAAVAALALLAGCGGDIDTTPPAQRPTSLYAGNSTTTSTTTSSSTSTSSTTAASLIPPVSVERRRAPVRASRSTAGPRPVSSLPAGTGAHRTVDSTAYCLTSRTADGGHGYVGSVAMNGQPFGSRWRVLTGPAAGRELVVTDRIGHGSSFDIWMPSCAAADAYGRHNITIERVA